GFGRRSQAEHGRPFFFGAVLSEQFLRSALLFGEAFADYVERVFGEIQHGQFLLGEPADFGGVAGGRDFSRNTAAEKINQNIVISNALVGVAEDAVVDSEQVAGFDGQAGLFAGLTDRGFAQQFADFEDAAGNRPLGLQRRMRTLHQHHARAFDDDGADSDQRDFGEFAVHGLPGSRRKDSIAWIE